MTSLVTGAPGAPVDELTKTVVLDTSVLVADPGAVHAMSVLVAALGGGRGGSLFGHIRLSQGERSSLATLASALL